ncbi:uncharacterized protein LOC124931538 isoform X2 [Impatiens glandulifera]|uniref:uncharacterized protein LOC124931538 isoform X2 n=1 Tax=Impatiens glandulifera TaxID=253017 RepID=UPI001FB0C30E|nr:uncharacterized protein LOC124931538 isoform X2 [Impatiens glandulifera]
MDMKMRNHHKHTRYASPLPPPSTYFNDLHHYNQHPTIPPPPFSTHSTPPPPSSSSYKPQQSQFTFSKHDNHRLVENDTRRQKSVYVPHHNPSPPRVSKRTLLDYNQPRFYKQESQNRLLDYSSSKVVVPESRRPFGLVREEDNHHSGISRTQVLSYRPFDNRRLDVEGRFRFRDEFQSKHSERIDSRVDDYQRSHDSYVSEIRETSRIPLYSESHSGSRSKLSVSKDFGADPGNYQSFDHYSLDSDRFLHNKELDYRELSGVRARLGNQFDSDDGDEISPLQHRPHIYPSGKSNYRGNKEGNHDFLQVTQKKIQKKSVLQRLQFVNPGNNNRSNGQHLSFAQSVGTVPNNLRGKGVVSYPEKRREEDRKESIVELDVCFNSNGLIAKTIVPTSTDDESHVNSRQRNKKLRELEYPLKYLICSTNSTIKPDSVTPDRFECLSDSSRDSKILNENCMKPSPLSICAGGSPGNMSSKELLSKKTRHAIPSYASPPLAFRKKKLIRPLSHMSNLEVNKKDSVAIIKSDGSKNIQSQDSLCNVTSGEANNYSSSDLVHDIVLQSSPRQITALLDNKLSEASCVLSPETNGVHSYSNKACIPYMEAQANTNISGPFLVSVYPLETEGDLHTLTARVPGCVDSFASTNSYEDSIKLKLGEGDSDILLVGGIQPQLPVDKYSLSRKSVGGKTGCLLSHPAETEVCRNHYSSVSFDNTHAAKKENPFSSVDSSAIECTFNQTSVLGDNISVDEDQRPTISLVKDSDMIGHLKKKDHIDVSETVTDVVGVNISAANLLDGNGKTESHMNLVSNLAKTDCDRVGPGPEGETLLLQNNLIQGPTVTAATSNLNISPVKKQPHRKRETEDTEIDSLKSTCYDFSLTVHSLLHQEEEKSSCRDNDDGHGRNKRDYAMLSVGESVTGTSPRCKKTRYISAPVSSFPTVSQIRDGPSCTEELTFDSDKFYTETEDRVNESNINISDSFVLGDNEIGDPSLDVTDMTGKDVICIDSKLDPEIAQITCLDDHNNVEHSLNFSTINSCCQNNNSSIRQIESTPEANTTLKINYFDAHGQDEHHRQQYADMECDNVLPDKDGLPSVSNSPSLYLDRNEASTAFPNRASPDTLFTGEEDSQFVEQNFEIGNTNFENLVSESRTPLVSFEKISITSMCSPNLGNTMVSSHTIPTKTGHSLLQPTPRSRTLRNNHLNDAILRVLPGYSKLKKAVPPDNKVKSRTSYRTGKPPSLPICGKNNLNAVSLQKQLPTNNEKVHNAYVWKGNSIVRKLYTVPAKSLSSPGLESSINGFNSLNCLKSELLQQPKTPLLRSKLFDCPNISSQNSASVQVINPPAETSSEFILGVLEQEENASIRNPSQTPQNQTCVTGSHNVISNESSKSGMGWKMICMKSNQLVASSSPTDLSVQNSVQTDVLPSFDGYVKWKENHLRRPLEDQAPKNIALRDASSNETWPVRKNVRRYCVFSRNVLACRKRDAIYTRSKHVFSGGMSTILSIGGSSFENTTGKRMYRIGSFYYKMDLSRRTLQRISGDLSGSGKNHAGADTKICVVPQRLHIGNDGRYKRLGNGNQLIRYPKRRARILASEIVRWSLHTARLCLAKKNTYCHFFTRFGKCNKDDGKCPYIHDLSKIAVCTKFIKGSCFNQGCKLTHKVIPERMEDCSYFLQGLCCYENCQYRHVNVNPNAPTCEGFLRGYCLHGDECRKKHSYVCPVFQSIGRYAEGSKCRLHPKRRLKGKRKIRKNDTKESNNAEGQYFGTSTCIDNADCSRSTTDQVNKDLFFQEGRLADYISLGVEEVFSTIIEDSSLSSDMETQIKPAFVLNRSSAKATTRFLG